MVAVPSMATAAVGARIKAADWNDDVRDTGDFLLTDRPACYAYANASPSHTSGTSTLIALDSEVDDNDSMHNTVTNNSRVVFTTAGRYFIICRLTYASNVNGRRELMVRKNSGGSSAGGTPIDYDAANAVNGFATHLKVLIEDTFAAADYIEMFGTQTSGAGLTIYGTALGGGQTSHCSIRARWVGTA